MVIGEQEEHRNKVIRAYANICMKCIEEIGKYDKGYAKGYSDARKEIKDFLK